MLGITTTDGLFLCSTSKDGKVAIASKTRLASSPILGGISWDHESKELIVASEKSIRRYDQSGRKCVESRGLNLEGPIKSMAVSGRRRATYFCHSSKLCCVESGKAITIVEGEFCSNVTAMSISLDSSFLACVTSPFWCFNLNTSTRTTLDGIHDGAVGACIFSLHSNSILFAASGGDLLIYDLSKSTFPTKRLAIGESNITALACCPVNPSRVAVIEYESRVSIVDIEQDKPIINTFSIPKLSSVAAFSPSGSFLHIGTSDGHLNSYSLREPSEKPDRTSLTKTGNVLGISVQIKTKSITSNPLLKVASLPSQRLPFADESNFPRVVSSPIKAKAAPRLSSVSGGSSTRISPATKASQIKASPKPSPIRSAMSKGIGPSPLQKRRTSHISTSRNSKASDRTGSEFQIIRQSSVNYSSEAVGVGKSNLLPRPLAENNPVSRSPSTTSTASSLHTPFSKNQVESSPLTQKIPPVTLTSPDVRSLTESPNLPSIEDDSATFVNPKFIQHPSALVDDQSKDRLGGVAINRLGHQKNLILSRKGCSLEKDNAVNGNVKLKKVSERATRNTSPAARLPAQNLSEGTTRLSCDVYSPFRSDMQEIVKDILQSMLYESRQETKNDIIGLHLDLVRMGRSWKAELRTLMNSYMEDLHEVQQENARLRIENERLRQCV